ncbi:MAG: hypothetical protein PHS07_02055 [Patescibacteria group bacterium]|nr:hypothetical protein [Patescibacteria group bacterium]
MNLKQYLILMAVATVICWTAFGLVLFNIDPQITDIWGFGMFYVSLFLSCMGTFAILGVLLRFKSIRNRPAMQLVVLAFRQAILFSLLIVFLLLLQSFKLLCWWNIILFLLFLTSLEIYFICRQARQQLCEQN